jgi:hypothetical protein
MGIQPVLSAPRSPWQRAYVERAIGTTRRESLDHVIVFGEAGLSRHLRRFADYCAPRAQRAEEGPMCVTV